MRPVVCSERALRSSNQEIETRSSSDCKNFNLDADANHYRTVRPVIRSERALHSSDHNTSQTRFSSDSKNLNLKEDENHYRTGRPVVCSERAPHSSDQDIETRLSRDSKNLNFEHDVNHYRTGRPVVCSHRAPQTRSSRIDFEEANQDRTVRPVVCSQSERSMLNEADIDFRISGLPHSVVKQVESSRVRELDLQFDLRQNEAYNPFSEKSKKMIKDMGYVELSQLCDTNPKTQCTECLLYWSEGIVYCTCGHLLRESEVN